MAMPPRPTSPESSHAPTQSGERLLPLVLPNLLHPVATAKALSYRDGSGILTAQSSLIQVRTAPANVLLPPSPPDP